METTVTGCKDCPMFSSYHSDRYGWETTCGHPLFESNGTIEEIEINENAEPTTPEKCPLNENAITISKTKDNESV